MFIIVLYTADVCTYVQYSIALQQTYSINFHIHIYTDTYCTSATHSFSSYYIETDNHITSTALVTYIQPFTDVSLYHVIVSISKLTLQYIDM
jgi:hypothetical protein